MNDLFKVFKNSIRIEESKNQISWKEKKNILFEENLNEKKIEIKFPIKEHQNSSDEKEESEEGFRFLKILFLKNLEMEIEICEIKMNEM